MKKEGAEALIGSGSGISRAEALNMKSSSTSDSYHQVAEDAMLCLELDSKATCSQERTWEFAEDKCTKRLVKKTWKALEAAENEHIFSPVKKSKKRKTLTLPLSVKPTRLIVRIPQMATDGVQGKENIVPDNCKEEFTLAMRNEAREREDRGKEGEKMERSKLIVRIPLLQKCGAEMVNCNPEFTTAMRNEERGRKERGKVTEVDITPNYRILPVEDLEPPSTSQTDLERSVLNDRVRLVHRDTNYHRALHDHEKDLLENEDKRFELDMLLEKFRSTVKHIELWINDVNHGLVNPMESYLSGGDRRCIEKLYGDQGVETVRILKEKPDSALPVTLARLRKKFDEVNNCHSDFNRA